MYSFREGKLFVLIFRYLNNGEKCLNYGNRLTRAVKGEQYVSPKFPHVLLHTYL